MHAGDFGVPSSSNSMRRFAFLHHPLGLGVAFVVAVAAACGDGVSPLGSVPGYYRLVAVNGQALPYITPPSGGIPPLQIWRGDLVLRANGTFAQGIGGNVGFGFLAEGTYQASNREVTLRLSGAPAGSNVTGPVSGDSISLSWLDYYGQPITLTYRRASLPPSSVQSTRYRLRSINGRTAEPLVSYDTTIGGTRYVGSVAFDSLTFSDGVFFRQHRSESAVAYPPSGLPLASAEEWTTWGAYESRAGAVVLLYYGPPTLSIPARDSLSIAGDTLVRRTPLVTGVEEERYVPVH